jgi:hypothetical protein
MHKLTKVRFKFSRIRRNNWNNIFVKVNKFFKTHFQSIPDPVQREPVDCRLRQREGRVRVLRPRLLGVHGHHQVRGARLRRFLLHSHPR